MRIYVQLAIPSQPVTNEVFVWPGIWLMCICLLQPVTFLVGSRGATGSSTNSVNWCVHGNSSDLSLGASLISCLLIFTKWLQEETGYLRENTVVLKFSVRPLNYYQKCKDLTLWVLGVTCATYSSLSDCVLGILTSWRQRGISLHSNCRQLGWWATIHGITVSIVTVSYLFISEVITYVTHIIRR